MVQGHSICFTFGRPGLITGTMYCLLSTEPGVSPAHCWVGQQNEREGEEEKWEREKREKMIMNTIKF